MSANLQLAIGCAAALVAALVLWIIVAWQRSHFTFAQAFLCLVNRFLARVLWRVEVSGPLPVASSEGVVIVCNHSSGIDPLAIQLCTDRVVHWMVAKEYFAMPGLNWAFRAVEAIPVNRGGIDTAATKLAIRYAQQGGQVGLFPEGRVNVTSDLLLPGRPGAALIALKARVNVVPVYVSGLPYDGTALGSLFMAGRGRVTVGEPIDLSSYFGREGDKSVLEDLTKRFLVEIARLAGVDDFEPRLAGRNWKSGPETDTDSASPVSTDPKPAVLPATSELPASDSGSPFAPGTPR